MNTKNSLILDVWGGLGDNLQVSTIPRRFFEKNGYKGVFISNSVTYRNNEIKELVWDQNPYIAGFTEEKGVNISESGLISFDGRTNWVQNMERVYNFNAPYSSRPEIYYNISTQDMCDVESSIVIDLSYSSESYARNMERYPYMLESARNGMQKLLTQAKDVTINVIYQPEHLNNVNFFEKLDLPITYNKIQVKSLYEYCNIIKHCKQYICSHSGCHALAAAIRKTCICFIQENYLNMRYFVFDGIKYISI